ncbi:MAG: MgtC/SapB family protein [Methanocellales archaeon]|nr:MgtC/SapB family protein [Methanocellales archaeon]
MIYQRYSYGAIYESLFKIGLSIALGMFIGIEREWAHKEAGIRTFALITLCGTIFSFIGHQLVVVGAVFVVILSAFISIYPRTIWLMIMLISAFGFIKPRNHIYGLFWQPGKQHGGCM